MILFLTSSPSVDFSDDLNPANDFLNNLKKYIPENARFLFITSDPDDPDMTEGYAEAVRISFEKAGFSVSEYRFCDRRNENSIGSFIESSDVIYLAGGHVPTENAFFRDLGLRSLIGKFRGVVIGCSAGTMNAAGTVYAVPELDGEAADPSYRRFISGLGLTKTMILPHYQACRNDVIDGLRLFEDIVFPDSAGRRFFALPDGSYLFSDGNSEIIFGEAYLIENGRMSRICENGRSVRL